VLIDNCPPQEALPHLRRANEDHVQAQRLWHQAHAEYIALTVSNAARVAAVLDGTS